MLSDRFSIHTINAALATGSRAEQVYRDRAAPSQALRDELNNRALAAGFDPTADHDLLFFGGRVIADMSVATIYLGGAEAWAPSDRENIDHALAVALSDPGLEGVIAQYFEQPPRCTFRPSVLAEGQAMRLITGDDVRAMARRIGEIEAGVDISSTLFLLLLPAGAVLTDDDGAYLDSRANEEVSFNPAMRESEAVSSFDGLGGYHGSVHLADGRTVYYAVCVYSDTQSLGRANGIPIWEQGWKNVVATAYHEIMEARTDPDVEDAINAGDTPEATRYIGWMSNQGEECGDFPVFEAEPLTEAFVEVPVAAGGLVPIQLQYSNAVHGPEGPVSTPRPGRR